jgi:tetratricopeptide (TPR) repeat protein
MEYPRGGSKHLPWSDPKMERKMKPKMKQAFALFLGLFVAVALSSAFAQLPPLGEPAKPAPNANPAPAGSVSVEAVNADLKTARAANAEKRFADAETLMLRDTAAKPSLPYPWIELGQAQLGLKKYADAEVSFKAALGGGTPAQKQPIAGAFYAEGKGTAAHVSVDTAAPPPDSKGTAEIQGTSYTGLGEVYIRTNRIPEAKDAFDKAVKANPAQAPLYLRNETIFFLQINDSADQVDAAAKAIAVDPTRAVLYFYKGQGLAAQSTIDAKTQKLILPAGCAEALQKYLDLDPTGQYSADAKGMLTAAGVAIKTSGKK